MLPQTRTKRALQRMAKRLGIFVVVVVVFACILERDNGAVVFRFFFFFFLRSCREGRRYRFFVCFIFVCCHIFLFCEFECVVFCFCFYLFVLCMCGSGGVSVLGGGVFLSLFS